MNLCTLASQTLKETEKCGKANQLLEGTAALAGLVVSQVVLFFSDQFVLPLSPS